MAYTKNDWACGDKITAEKLNKIEQGIEDAQNGYECTESQTTLTEESVTTVGEDGSYSARLTYSNPITADVIKVTFDGVEYECPRMTVGSDNAYGATGPDFSEYPFAIVSSLTNRLYTQSAGTYTLKIEVVAESVTTTPCFEKAVRSVVKGGKAFTYVGEGTCGENTYTEYNITYNDFISARDDGTNIVYTLTDADELQARNIVAFNCAEKSEWYEVQAIYAQVIAGTPAPTIIWTPLALFCDTVDGYMRNRNCWQGIS